MKAKGERRKSKERFRRRCCAALLFFALFTSAFRLPPSAFVWAAHPFITDDAGTQGKGGWQLELLAQRNRHESVADAGTGPAQQSRRATLLNPVLTYGLLDNVDLAFGLNHLRFRVAENGVPVDEASGRSDSTLELKWRFVEKDGLSLAVKPGLSLPTGDENRGLGLGRVSWGVNFIASYDAKPWSVMGNVAWFRPRFKLAQDAADNRENLWRVSAGAAYSVNERHRLVGELGARTNEARSDPFQPGRNAHFGMLGWIYSPTEKIDFDFGVRKGLNRAETDTVLLAGATFRW